MHSIEFKISGTIITKAVGLIDRTSGLYTVCYYWTNSLKIEDLISILTRIILENIKGRVELIL